MRKKAILIVLLLSVITFSFTACISKEKPSDKPKSVKIEAYHPKIEGKIVPNSYYFKYDGKPKIFDIKIYCVQDNRYLNNEDFVRGDINSLIVVTIRKNEQSISTRIDINNQNEWPTEVGVYRISINFNGFVLKEHEIDPNYYGAPALYFTLIIEENDKND